MVTVVRFAGMRMFVYVGQRLRGSSEKFADFVGREERNDFLSGLKFVSDVLKMMRVHNAQHHFLVHGQGHIYLGAFDDCRPVLVADSVSQFQASPDDFFRL